MKKYPELTRETAAFIEGLEAKNDPPLYTLSYQDARAVLAAAQSGPTPRPEADVTDFEIPFGEGGAVELRIVRPKDGKGRLPVVFYIHGGGWVMGDKNTHDRLVREIAVRTGAAVVFVNYTPSPEAQYPVPLRQIMTALRYIVAHADELKLDAARIAVAGDSVGGNMAAALTLMCKAENGPRLRFQLLLYPVTDASLDTDSYREFADGPWLTKKAMEYFWDAYAPDKKSRREITASPLLATAEQLKGLPPAFVITDANDVLRDEGEAYAVRLMQAGVPTGAARYAGTIHDFLMLDAVADTIPAKAALAQACGVLREALAEYAGGGSPGRFGSRRPPLVRLYGAAEMRRFSVMTARRTSSSPLDAAKKRYFRNSARVRRTLCRVRCCCSHCSALAICRCR